MRKKSAEQRRKEKFGHHTDTARADTAGDPRRGAPLCSVPQAPHTDSHTRHDARVVADRASRSQRPRPGVAQGQRRAAAGKPSRMSVVGCRVGSKLHVREVESSAKHPIRKHLVVWPGFSRTVGHKHVSSLYCMSLPLLPLVSSACLRRGCVLVCSEGTGMRASDGERQSVVGRCSRRGWSAARRVDRCDSYRLFHIRRFRSVSVVPPHRVTAPRTARGPGMGTAHGMVRQSARHSATGGAWPMHAPEPSPRPRPRGGVRVLYTL
jgi:hypothetical protein